MKKVLSLLLAYVFLQTECWALSGGPQFGTQDGQSLVGTYAGALLPSEAGEDTPVATDGTGTVTETATGANGLGLFTLSIPDTGLGTGDFVYFSEGRTFTGTITGLADPERLELIGLLKGQFDIIIDNIQINDNFFGDASLVQTRPGGFANGQIRADFVGSGSATFFTGFGTSSFVGLRLDGTATVEISEPQTTTTDTGTTTVDPVTGEVVTTPGTSTTTDTVVRTSLLTLIVDGFQQSATAEGGAGTLAGFSGTSQ